MMRTAGAGLALAARLACSLRQICLTTTLAATTSGLMTQAVHAGPSAPEPPRPSCSYSSSASPRPSRPDTHRTPYALRSGTPRPSPWPVLEPVALAPSTGAPKWHRSLYRFPEEVQVTLSDRQLALSGRAGTIRLNLRQLDPTGLVAFKIFSLGPDPGTGTGAAGGAAAAGPTKQLLALATPDKRRFNALLAELEASVRGVSVGYLVGITVKGVGYRIEPITVAPRKRSWYFEADKADPAAATFPYPSPVPAVRLKVGYSQTAVFPFPPGIRAFCIKPALLYLYGLRKEEVDAVAAQIRAIRKPNVYTGNGIQLLDEVVRIKQRKASK